MTVDVTGTVLFLEESGQIDLYKNVTIQNNHKVGNERILKEKYLVSNANRVGGAAMIISDGHHLPGELVKIIIQTKGVDKVIITSDQAEATGFKPGRYHVLGNDAVLEPNGKLHNPVKKCLVGSASTIGMCMNFLESLNVWTEEELTKLGRTNALKYLQ
jgi:N-acetylglucosamine-6-phosphate deacetylase